VDAVPGNTDAPPFALLTEWDMRSFAGQSLFDRGAAAVVAASTYYYEDALSLLNGRGSEGTRDLGSDISASVGVAIGTITATVNADDRLEITSTDVLSSFAVSPGADNAFFGFDVAGQAGGPTITAAGEWTRGTRQNRHLSITYTPGIGAPVGPFFAPSIPYSAQGIVNMLRPRDNAAAVNDSDNLHFADCIEVLDNATHATDVIRWGLSDTGRTFASWDASAGLGDVVWISTTFRDRLGFTGAEVPLNVLSPTGASVRVLLSTFPAAGVLVPTRPLVRLLERREEVTRTLRLTDGDVASNASGASTGWDLSFFLDGPADSRDLHRHWLEQWLPYAQLGGHCSIYQQWGDPRRAVSTRASTHSTSNTPAYSLLSTPEQDGERGRLRCRRDPSDASRRQVQWPGVLRRRVPTSLVLSDRVD